jgi:hypothetical protein
VTAVGGGVRRRTDASGKGRRSACVPGSSHEPVADAFDGRQSVAMVARTTLSGRRAQQAHCRRRSDDNMMMLNEPARRVQLWMDPLDVELRVGQFPKACVVHVRDDHELCESIRFVSAAMHKPSGTTQAQGVCDV